MILVARGSKQRDTGILVRFPWLYYNTIEKQKPERFRGQDPSFYNNLLWWNQPGPNRTTLISSENNVLQPLNSQQCHTKDQACDI